MKCIVLYKNGKSEEKEFKSDDHVTSFMLMNEGDKKQDEIFLVIPEGSKDKWEYDKQCGWQNKDYKPNDYEVC